MKRQSRPSEIRTDVFMYLMYSEISVSGSILWILTPLSDILHTYTHTHTYRHNATKPTSIFIKASIYSYSIVLINSESTCKSTTSSDQYVNPYTRERGL
jgi:hypothetical protein